MRYWPRNRALNSGMHGLVVLTAAISETEVQDWVCNFPALHSLSVTNADRIPTSYFREVLLFVLANR